MGDDWVDVGAEVYEDDEDEFEYLAPPDLDPDYLDEKDGDEEVLWRPFSTIHDPPQAFDSANRRVFLPGQPIKVHIKEVERTGDGRLLNPYLYHIELKHADYEWTIVKRYKHFSNLHEALSLFRARLRIAVPTRTHRERRKSFAKRRQTLPRFPRKPDALLRPDDLEQRRAQMELYLQNILRSPQFRNRHETLKFLEVSHLSFVLGLGPKLREGNVKKRSGGQRSVHRRCCGCFQQLAQNVTAHWDTRWLVLKDTFVALIRPADGMVRDVLLVDSEFEAMSGTASTGMREGIRITNLTRDLMMKCQSNQNAIHWKQSIMDAIAVSAKDFMGVNRHGSFAPARKDSYASWFVDGSMYMNSVADAMERAKEEIFITDWWLSPEIYMKRPITEGEYWRLDMILQRKAEEGVKIFIVIFKEMEMALGINSFYTKQALLKLHPTNIKVMRHPDGINFWSHHEKCVVIDQRIAFLGGIDLCYGRWDTPEHRLTDLGSINVASPGFEQDSAGFFKHLEKQTSQGLLGVVNKARSGVEHVMRASSWPTTVSDLLTGGKEKQQVKGSPQPHVEGGVEFVDTPSPAQVKKPLFPIPKLDAIKEQTSTDIDEVDYSEVIVESYPENNGENKKEVMSESNKVKATSVIQGWGALTTKSKTSQNGHAQDDAAGVAKRQRSHTDVETTELLKSGTKTRSKSYMATTQVSSEMKLGTTTFTSETTEKWQIENVNVTDSGQVELVIKKPDCLDLKASTTDSPDISPQQKGKVERKLKYSYGSLNRTSDDNDSDYSDAHSTLSEISDDRQRPYVDTGHVNPLMTSPMGTSRSELDSQCTETETLSTLGSTPASPMKSLLGENDMPCGQETPAAKEQDPLQRLAAKLKRAESSQDESSEGGGSKQLLTALSSLSAKPSFHEADQSSDTESSQATLPRRRVNTDDDMEIIYNPALEVIAMSPNTGLNTDILAGIASVALKAQQSEEEKVVKEDPKVENEKLQQALRMWTNAARQARAPAKKVDAKSPNEGDPPDGDKKRMRLKLQRVSRQKAVEGEGENGMVLDASRLQSPETPEFQQPWPSPKPSTPPARKRFAMKAQEIKSDIRERFKRRKSKSLDVSVEGSGDGDADSTMYRAFNDCADPADILDELGSSGSKIWVGKDYTNFIFKDFVDLDKPFTDFIDRTKTPRMPWHDIGAVVYGKPARDVARHFIQRWNFTKLEKRKTNLDYPLLLPKTYSKVTVPRRVLLNSIPCDCQILRSSSSWSAGIQHTDSSIHQGYIDTILTSKHYIYIENQFFVTIDNHISLHNEIGGALFQRISRAHSYGEKFRVYVVMPLLPAFEGELGTGSGASIQAITHWNYSSISRGGKSLIERLLKHGVQDPTEYVTFYGLRTHTELVGNLHSELVYVHSKLMIVDDQKVIIGSANINDRSMLGDRDSELAVLVEDSKFMPSRMDGEEYQAGWFASSLRKTLFREHLGVRKSTNTDIDVTDPVIDTFYKNQWIRTAAINTSVYDKVFRCLPTDHVRTFSQLHEYQKKEPLSRSDPDMARTLLERVSGHLVFMPLMFLVEENLQPTVGTKEALVPTAIWT